MRILIVDDEELVRKSLERAFLQKGHEVRVASGGEEAIELWKSYLPEIVMLDVLMPDLSGPDVLSRINKANELVVLMSAYKGKYDTSTVKSLGADEFIAKPFDNIFDVVKGVEEIYGSEKRSTTS